MARSTERAPPEGANLLLPLANLTMVIAIVSLAGWPQAVLFTALGAAPLVLVTLIALSRGR